MREFVIASQIVRWLVTIEVRDIRGTQSRPPDKGKNANELRNRTEKRTALHSPARWASAKRETGLRGPYLLVYVGAHTRE
jgi:hypothetical protein